MLDGLERMADDSKAVVRMPSWVIIAFVGLLGTGFGMAITAGTKSNQLDSVISQTAAVQSQLATISEKLSKIQSHEEAGDQKFSDIDRRISNVETLVERNREELEAFKSTHR